MPASRNGDACHGVDRTVVFILAVDRTPWLTSVTDKRYLAMLCNKADPGNGDCMSNTMNELVHRARICPVACALIILLSLLLISAINIAIFFKDAMSIDAYIGLTSAIAYVAILAIATNGNCQIKLSE